MNIDPMMQAALLTPAEMGRADALAIAGGVPGAELMEQAGRAVARAVIGRFVPAPTLVLCGPGNNGGDGYVAARYLAERGWPVSVAALAPPRPDGDAALAVSRWRGPIVPFTPTRAAAASLVIDAVFGAGLVRDVDGLAAETLRAARLVVAVDTPSGVDGATGAVRGYAPQAELTVTFFRRKPGHLLLPGRDLCGETMLVQIGIPASVLGTVRPANFSNGPSLWRLPEAGASDHKYSRGHVTVLGGAMTGAARLAAASARRAGAGLVTIAGGAHAETYRHGEPGVIVSEAPLAELLADPRRRVFVCGPGLGAAQAGAALAVLRNARRHIVADADVFTACADHPERLSGCTVLTPHAGEFARVFGSPGADRLAAARTAAARTGAVLLLKGSDTIIAAPDGRASINSDAPPWLATAGAGDVLSGIIGGLLGQGMEPWDAAAAGAWLHGRAAALCGPGLIAEDLIPAIVRAATGLLLPTDAPKRRTLHYNRRHLSGAV